MLEPSGWRLRWGVGWITDFFSLPSPISPGRRDGRIPDVAAELILRLGLLPRAERSALSPPTSFSSGGLFHPFDLPQQR